MHNRAWAGLAALLLLFASSREAASAQTSAPAPLSLDAAVSLALDRNDGYRIAHTDVAAAQGQLRQAAGPQLPSVAASDGLNYANPVAELSTPFGALPFSTTTMTNVPMLTLSYQLFDGGRTAARVSQAAAALAGAEADERTARMSLIDKTTKAYFDLVAAMQYAIVADRSVEVAQAQVDDARRFLAAGQVPRADVLRAETQLADQRVQDLSARNAVALAQTALDDALGVPLGDLHQPTDPLEAGAPDVALLAAARTNRGDVAAAQAAVDAAGYALKEARSGHAPRVGIALADGTVQPAVVPGYRNQFSIGLNAVWTLFDGGTTAGQIDAAQAGIERAKLTLDRVSTDVELQVRQAALNLSDAKARVDAAESYVTLADENLRLAQVRYRGGVGTVLELQDAQLRATLARQALISAQVAVREGIVHVRFAAGLL